MYKNPQVSIQLTESPNESVTLTGELHGIIPVAGGKRLFDVLSLGGGFPATASHTVIINRPGITEPIVVDLGTDPALSNFANVPVFPRDTIVVSRVGLGDISLAGRVRSPGRDTDPAKLAADLDAGCCFGRRCRIRGQV